MTRRSSDHDADDGVDLGTRIYRIFLLAVIFGVLWVKGYLWCVFSIAVLLYLGHTLLLALIMAASESSGPSSRPQRPSSGAAPGRSAAPAAGPPADETAEKPGAADDDFREPRPSRPAPRRRAP